MSTRNTSFNKAFESRLRLGIMSFLAVHESVDFNTLKEYLESTDGNLASHISSLEKLGYIEVKKQFLGKKPNTTYLITEEGRLTFSKHLNALEQIIKQSK